MDWIVQRVMKKMEHTGIKIQYTKQRKWLNMKERDLTETILVNTLLYADDMVILDANFDNVKMFVEEFNRELCSVGMMMNVKKTKMMVLNGKVKEPITLRGEKIDVEDSFPYLGVSIKTQQSRSGGSGNSDCESNQSLQESVSSIMEEKASVSENQDGDLSSSSVTGVVVWE